MKKVLFCLFAAFGFMGFSQDDCLLGIGGKDDEIITEVFQLNDEQKEKLRDWSAELKVRNDILSEQAKYLLKKNEESSPEVLMTFSHKYREILDSMKRNVRMIDKRMLAIFNDRQYKLYRDLCSQMTLRPIHIERSVDEK